jgi:hypothetical protein
MENQALPTLRPLSLGELLDRAIRLYRGNFLTFIGIIAVVYIPLMVLQTAAAALMGSSLSATSVSPPQEIISNPGYWIAIILSLVLWLAQFVLVQGIATGALTRAVADTYLGKRTGILDAYRGIGRSWLTLLAALSLIVLIFLALSLWWLLVPCIGWFTGLGMMVFLMAVVNPLVAPVIVVEASGPWSTPTDNVLDRFSNWILRSLLAVNRAWSLARRRFWPVMGYIAVLYLFSWILVSGPQAIANVVLVQIFPSFGDEAMQLILTSIVQGLVQLVFVLIYYPLQMTAFTLIYFDLRVRTEGFDIAFLTLEKSGATDLSEATAVPVPQLNERFMTGADLGNFAILELAGAGIYIFFVTILAAIVLFLAALTGN